MGGGERALGAEELEQPHQHGQWIPLRNQTEETASSVHRVLHSAFNSGYLACCHCEISTDMQPCRNQVKKVKTDELWEQYINRSAPLSPNACAQRGVVLSSHVVGAGRGAPSTSSTDKHTGKTWKSTAKNLLFEMVCSRGFVRLGRFH